MIDVFINIYFVFDNIILYFVSYSYFYKSIQQKATFYKQLFYFIAFMFYFNSLITFK